MDHDDDPQLRDHVIQDDIHQLWGQDMQDHSHHRGVGRNLKIHRGMG